VPGWVGKFKRLEALEVSGVEYERNALLESLPASLGQLDVMRREIAVRGVEVIKNAVVDLRLGITADGSYVVVIREVVQCALLMLERGARRFLSDPAMCKKKGGGREPRERQSRRP